MCAVAQCSSTRTFQVVPTDDKERESTMTTTTTAASRRTKHRMIDDITTHTVAETAAAALTLWPALTLCPGDKKAAKSLRRITAWADQQQVTLLSELTGPVAGAMLRELTGGKNLAQVTDPKALDRLHRLRNTLIAMRGTVLIADETLQRRRSDRPASDSLALGLPALPARTPQKRRPLEDDEIMLGRVLVEIDLRERAPVLPVIAYLLGESAVRPMPSTTLSTNSFDDRSQPTTVTRPGVWGAKERKLPLTEFAARNMARALLRLPEGKQRLTYTGARPGKKEAAASLSPVISRFLARAGIECRTITPLGLSLWRPYRALVVKQNFTKARYLHGGTVDSLLNDFKADTDESDIYNDIIHIYCRISGNRIATVPAWTVG